MDIVRLAIPYSFVRDRIRLTWRCVLFGVKNELLDPNVPNAFAFDQLATIEEPSSALLDLASGRRGELAMSLVEQLAHGEADVSEKKILETWLYLALAWIYANRASDPDPLERVAEVYADFGYPEQIASFVRYMPMQGPDLGSREANVERLFERWEQFVQEGDRIHNPQS